MSTHRPSTGIWSSALLSRAQGAKASGVRPASPKHSRARPASSSRQPAVVGCTGCTLKHLGNRATATAIRMASSEYRASPLRPRSVRRSLIFSRPVMRCYAWLVAVAAIAANMSACSADCDELKARARSLRSELGECEEGDACVLVSVAGDRTGALSCEVPVHASNETRARDELGAVAVESNDCDSCARAECPAVTIAACNPSTGRCEAG